MPINDVVKRSLANKRRAECDARLRRAGKVRMSLWIDGEGAAALEALAKANGGDRGLVVSMAARYLIKLAREGVTDVSL